MPADSEPRVGFSPVLQTGVTGAGTALDPLEVNTVVDVGETGLRITQTDSYVVGRENYRTRISVENTGSTAVNAALYHAGDCFLQDSDVGFGWVDTASNGIYCSGNANNDPVGRIEGFVPLSAGSSYMEGFYASVWAAIDGTQFANTCSCASAVDNGAGLSWALSIAGGATVERELLTAFSPEGTVPDSAPPAVTLSTPADGARTSDTTPQFTGAAGDADEDLAEVKVKVYAGSEASGTPVQEISTNRSGATWSMAPSTALAEGTYTAQAEQRDASGNTGTSAANTFTIDTSSPAVTVTQPAAGATTNDRTPELAGAIGDAPGDEGEVTVKVYSGASPAGTPVQTLNAEGSDGSWSTTPSPLADGTYTVQAEQSDDLGHVGLSNARTFTVDTTAPAVSLTTPADGASTTDTTPALEGAAGAAAGDAGTVSVRLFAGSSASGAAVQSLGTTRSGGGWSTVAEPLEPGTYTARAEQADSAQNNGLSSANTFTITQTLTDIDGPLPPPLLGKQVNVVPVGDGPVYLSVPGGTASASLASAAASRGRVRAAYKAPVKRRKFVRLRRGMQIPVGSLLDARRGRVRLTTARTRAGRTQTSDFFKGSFKVKQSRKRKRKGLTELVLIGGDFRGCRRWKTAIKSDDKLAETSRRRRRTRRRRLWGRGRGRFRTRGRHGSATVRGTTWFVEDRCAGTLFRVKKGKVVIRDRKRKKRIVLTAGERYLVRR